MTVHSTFNSMVLSLILAGSVSTASAQNVKVDPEQGKLLLAASSTETLQKELDKAGALGFRAVLGTTRGNGELVVLMERDPSAKNPVQHLLIATNTTGTFKKEIDAAAAKGYRTVPQTFLNKPTGFIGNEIVVLMERSVNPTKRYQYELLSTNQTSTLEAEWSKYSGLKYTAVGFLTRAEVMLLMEREAK